MWRYHSRMDERESLLLIEKLITDEEFDKLKDYSKDINIFKVTGIDLKEIRHSNTIAWLLRPYESHNLGSMFFQKFVAQLFEENPDYFNDRNINIFQLLLNDLDDLEVYREKENMDILIVSRKRKLVFCIENKIEADIDDEQLDKYYETVTEQYSSFKKVFLLLWPSGDDVPDDKTKHPEDWISTSYENIVKILRSILKLDIEQKVRYIIGDYIKILEKGYIVENVELDKILSSLYAKHKDAIDLLVTYCDAHGELQPGIRRVKEILKKTFLGYEGKIRCNKDSLDKSVMVFYTPNMDKYFPPVNDKSGYWREGTKYRYWINLKERKPNKPHIRFELNPHGQDDDTIRYMNKIIKLEGKKEVTASDDKLRRTKDWNININWDSLEDLEDLEDFDEWHIEAEIKDVLEKIINWEETVANKIFNK